MFVTPLACPLPGLPSLVISVFALHVRFSFKELAGARGPRVPLRSAAPFLAPLPRVPSSCSHGRRVWRMTRCPALPTHPRVQRCLQADQICACPKLQHPIWRRRIAWVHRLVDKASWRWHQHAGWLGV